MLDADHIVICNSVDCDYNNEKGNCIVVEIEISDGKCVSFQEVKKWQLNLENN